MAFVTVLQDDPSGRLGVHVIIWLVYDHIFLFLYPPMHVHNHPHIFAYILAVIISMSLFTNTISNTTHTSVFVGYYCRELSHRSLTNTTLIVSRLPLYDYYSISHSHIVVNLKFGNKSWHQGWGDYRTEVIIYDYLRIQWLWLHSFWMLSIMITL